jgi:hypothetical protein
MSRENVELVRSATEAYIAGEREAFVDDFFAEDVEVCPDLSRFPEAKRLRGRDEFKRFLADSDEGWEGGASTSEIKELVPVRD